MNFQNIDSICTAEIKQFFKDIHELDSIDSMDIFRYANKLSDDEFVDFIIDLRSRGRFAVAGKDAVKEMEKARKFAEIASEMMKMLRADNKMRWKKVDNKVTKMENNGVGKSVSVKGINVTFM